MDENRKFFGCWDLRRGSIVFAWLQMMLIVTVISVLSGVLDISQAVANRKEVNGDYDDNAHLYWPMIIKMEIGGYVIKGATLIALTWGLAKRKHLFYQPWLFVSLIELGIQMLIILFYLIALFDNSRLIKQFVTTGLGTALNGYIFFCIYTVYKADKENKATAVKYDEEYNSVPLEPTNYIIKK